MMRVGRLLPEMKGIISGYQPVENPAGLLFRYYTGLCNIRV